MAQALAAFWRTFLEDNLVNQNWDLKNLCVRAIVLK